MMTRKYGKGYDEGYADGLKDAPQRTWVGLTDDELLDAYLKSNGIEFYKAFARSIEAKLEEKNNA